MIRAALVRGVSAPLALLVAVGPVAASPAAKFRPPAGNRAAVRAVPSGSMGLKLAIRPGLPLAGTASAAPVPQALSAANPKLTAAQPGAPAPAVVFPVAGQGPAAVARLQALPDRPAAAAAPRRLPAGVGAAGRSENKSAEGEKAKIRRALRAETASILDGLDRLFDNRGAPSGSAAPAAPEVDGSWPIPALVVQAGQRMYYLHGVSHNRGGDRPLKPGRMRRLVRALEKKSLPLYSEERFPAHYGYDYGREAAHLSEPDRAPLRRPAPARRGLARAAHELLDWTLYPGSPGLLAASGAWLLARPDFWPAWGAFLFVSLLHVLRWHAAWVTFLNFQVLAWKEAWRGNAELAAYWRRYAALMVQGRWLDPLKALEVYRSTPPALAAADLRGSLGMARSIQEDAEVQGHSKVHILVGVNHVPAIAWALRHPKDLND